MFVNILLLFITAMNFSLILYNNNNYKTSVKCYGTNYNRTCIYKNIYYHHGEWLAINLSENKIKCVAIRSRSTNLCFKPTISKYTIKYNRIIYGITTYIGLFFTGNIAHLLWDDLYSLYLSLLKLNYIFDPFKIILSKYDTSWRDNWQSKIFERFSMNKLLYENDMQNNTYLIKTLIVGLGHQCQRCTTKDYSIPGGKNYKATWWMRKRMYDVYNVKQCNNRYAIIVHNKRYSKEEKNLLYYISQNYNNSVFQIKYIDWSKIPNFKRQLEVLSCTCIYISGPGTGLLNFPFVSDPGVIINLGGLYRGCPSFMEQYIQEGSMHFISLYYPSNKRIYGIKKEEVDKLVNKAINMLKNWNKYKNHHRTNLNIEGEIFRSISRKNSELMNKFLIDTDWAKDNGIGVWAEKLIYFPYCYNRTYIVDKVFNETKKYKNKLGCVISKSKKLCD